MRTETRMSTLPLLFNIVLEFLGRPIRQEKKIRGIQIGKKNVKLSLCADDILFYLKVPKCSTNNSYIS
jgi:hypothetical protein